MSGLSYIQAVMMGLASDGGLLVPQSIPDVKAELKSWRTISYQGLAFEIMRRFLSDLPETDLKHLIEKSYNNLL